MKKKKPNFIIWFLLTVLNLFLWGYIAINIFRAIGITLNDNIFNLKIWTLLLKVILLSFLAIYIAFLKRNTWDKNIQKKWFKYFLFWILIIISIFLGINKVILLFVIFLFYLYKWLHQKFNAKQFKFIQYGKITLKIVSVLLIFSILGTQAYVGEFNKATGSAKLDVVAWELKSLSVGLGKDRKSTRLNSSHIPLSRMPSSA